MIIVCFIYFDNSLFWPLYGCIPNAKNVSFLLCKDEKNPNFKSENIKEKIIIFSSKLCVKLFIWIRSTFSADYRHISRATTM